MNIISIIVWLGLAAACGYIHSNKGYSFMSGFICGLLLPVVSIIFVLLEKEK